MALPLLRQLRVRLESFRTLEGQQSLPNGVKAVVWDLVASERAALGDWPGVEEAVGLFQKALDADPGVAAVAPRLEGAGQELFQLRRLPHAGSILREAAEDLLDGRSVFFLELVDVREAAFDFA